MAKGSETRGSVNDPYLNIQDAGVKPNDLPLAPVQAPRPSSFSNVGSASRDLASLLSRGSDLMAAYFEKKKDEWRIDGQLAFAQGKTAEELSRTGGNEYTVQGFQATKASTALELWAQQKKLDLNNGDEQKDPTQYSAELSSGFGTVMQGINDPYVRKLISAHAEQTLPALASAQMISHAKYKQAQTIQANTANLGALANSALNDPAKVQELHSTVTALSQVMRPDDYKEVVTNAFILGEQSDNHVLTDVIGGINSKLLNPETPDLSQPLNIRNNNPGNLRDSKGQFRVFPTAAAGQTALEADLHAKIAGNSPAMKSHPELGTQPTLHKLINVYAPKSDNNNTDAYIAFVSGKTGITKDQVLTTNDIPKLSLAMAAFEGSPNPNASSKRAASITNTLNDLSTNLLKQGFTAPQVEKMVASTKERMNRVDTAFNAQQILDTEQLKAQAEQSTSRADVLQQLQDMAKVRGYDSKWLKSTSDDLMRAFDKGEVQRLKTQDLRDALATNTLALHSKSEQQAALALGRQDDAVRVQQAYAIGAYNAEAQQRGISPEQVAIEKRQGLHLTRLVANRVVDDTVAQQLSTDIRLAGTLKTSDIQDSKTGQLTQQGQQVLNSIGMYYQLRSMKGSSVGFARKFLDDESAKLMNEIISRDSTGQNLLGALTDATTSLNRPDNLQIKDISVGSVKDDVQKYIQDNLDPGFFDWMFGGVSGTGPFDIFDNEVRAWSNDPILNATASNIATKYKFANPQISNGAAVQEAMAQIKNRGEFIGGSFLLGPEKGSIKEQANLADINDPLIMHKATLEYIQKFGPLMWSTYNNTQLVGRPDLASFNDQKGFIGTLMNLPTPSISKMGASIADLYRGVPEASYKYNPQNETIVVDLYRNKEGTVLNNQPREIPLAEIGAWWRQNHAGPTITNRVIKGTKALAQPVLTKALTEAEILAGKAASSETVTNLLK